MNIIKGYITYLRKNDKTNTVKLRVGARIWVYVKSTLLLTDVYLGTYVEFINTREVKNQNFTYTTDGINYHNLKAAEQKESVIKKIKIIAEKQSKEIYYEIEELLVYLYLMKRQGLLKKILSWSYEKQAEISANPYLLYTRKYLDYYSAEAISDATNNPANPDAKIDAVTLHIMTEDYKNGSESMRITDLKEQAGDILNSDIEIDKLMKLSKHVKFEGEYVYLNWLYYLRQKAISLLTRNTIRDSIDTIHNDPQITELLKNKYVVLVGNAGTGKTHLLRKLSELPLKITYTALTGKAAKLLSESAGTLHRTLGYAGSKFTVEKLETDILVIDETSMINWHTLYAAAKTCDSIIFSGDPNQLPPIHGESVFKTMLNILPKVTLEKNYRFKNGNTVEVIKRNSVKDTIGTMRAIMKCISRKGKPYQVITPINEGYLGVKSINLMLQGCINPNGNIIEKGKNIRIGDKIIVTKNTYCDGEMIAANGEIGKATGFDMGMGYVIVNINTRTVLLDSNSIDLAYCLTVHKSQGSEYDYVIFILPGNGEFMTQQLIEVGKTRGKEKTYVIEYQPAGAVGAAA